MGKYCTQLQLNVLLCLRFVYIRYASGLVRDSAKLLHLIVVIFLLFKFLRRSVYTSFIQLWNGRDFQKFPMGKICMMTNLSHTCDGQIDKDFNLVERKIKIAIFLSFIISMYILIYGSYSSFRDR